jgi:hypothetical protein
MRFFWFFIFLLLGHGALPSTLLSGLATHDTWPLISRAPSLGVGWVFFFFFSLFLSCCSDSDWWGGGRSAKERSLWGLRADRAVAGLWHEKGWGGWTNLALLSFWSFLAGLKKFGSGKAVSYGDRTKKAFCFSRVQFFVQCVLRDVSFSFRGLFEVDFVRPIGSSVRCERTRSARHIPAYQTVKERTSHSLAGRISLTKK